MSTWELDAWLRKQARLGLITDAPRPYRPDHNIHGWDSFAPKGWDSGKLAREQEAHAARTTGADKTLYRLYTQDLKRNQVQATVAIHFDGATFYYGVGLDRHTQDASENSVTIEIISSHPSALARVLALASDIRQLNSELSVLVTSQPVTTFEVTA